MDANNTEKEILTGLSSQTPLGLSIAKLCPELCLLIGTEKDSLLQNEEGRAQRP